MIRAKISRKRFLPMERFKSVPARVDIAVGLVGPKATVKHVDSALTVVEIGIVHEFGTETIPARHWLSKAAIRQRKLTKTAYRIALKKQLKKSHMNLNAVAMSTGALVARQIRMHMTKGPHFRPKLALSTIEHKRRKGSADPKRPIFDTGQIAASVSWQKI